MACLHQLLDENKKSGYFKDYFELISSIQIYSSQKNKQKNYGRTSTPRIKGP